MPLALRLSLLVWLGLVVGWSRQPSSIAALASASLATIDGTIALPSLRAEVRVVRDTWGVPHIYAQSSDDLFFAQGFVMAQDRLWQMEMWRRAGEGRLAQILGPSAAARDRVARLLKYRGLADDREMPPITPRPGG
jgi:penicillin amidase